MFKLPEPLIHFTIPYIIARTRLSLKKSIIIGLAGLAPDIDALFLIHRWFTHSIFFVIAIFLPIYFITTHIFRKNGFRDFLLLIFIGIAIHILMDLFQSYTPILYPFSEYSFWINFEANIFIGDTIKPTLNMEITKIANNFSKYSVLDAPLFTSEGFIISVILLITVEYAFEDGVLNKLKNIRAS